MAFAVSMFDSKKDRETMITTHGGLGGGGVGDGLGLGCTFEGVEVG